MRLEHTNHADNLSTKAQSTHAVTDHNKPDQEARSLIAPRMKNHGNHSVQEALSVYEDFIGIHNVKDDYHERVAEDARVCNFELN